MAEIDVAGVRLEALCERPPGSRVRVLIHAEEVVLLADSGYAGSARNRLPGRVTEVKRITLDAGHNLNRFESRYAGTPAGPKMQAAGVKKAPGSEVAQDKARGLLRTWEPVKADGSHFGCGVIVDPARLAAFAEADGNVLAVTALSAGSDITYYAGSGWNKSGDFTTAEDWDRYLDQAARRIRSPLAISIAAQ
jgi:hypothetical protein